MLGAVGVALGTHRVARFFSGDWLRDLDIGPWPHVTIIVKNLGKFTSAVGGGDVIFTGARGSSSHSAPLWCTRSYMRRTYYFVYSSKRPGRSSLRTENSTVHFSATASRQVYRRVIVLHAPTSNRIRVNVRRERILMLSRENHVSFR